MSRLPILPGGDRRAGPPGQARGSELALDFVDACPHRSDRADRPVVAAQLYLSHTVAWVKVLAECRFGFRCDGEPVSTRTVVPSMQSQDERVIRRDCLRCLLERMAERFAEMDE